MQYLLTEILTGEGHPQGRFVADLARAARGDELVALSFPHTGQFQVRVSGPEGESVSRVYTAAAEQFACRPPSVILRRRPHWVFGSGQAFGVARFSETLDLQSGNGYLVVKWQEHSFILMGFVVPMTYRESDWYRFERYRDER